MSSDDTRRGEITGLLLSATEEGGELVDRLWPLIYDDLRAIAHRQLQREQPGHTLLTTDLVHEAFFKLVDSTRVASRGRAYFFAAAARAMRQILIDRARRRQRLKRSRPEEMAPPERIAVDEFAADLLDLNDALERFSREHPRPARVVEYRFFGGLSVEEAAEALGVSERTVKSDWALARAWLSRALGARGGA